MSHDGVQTFETFGWQTFGTNIEYSGSGRIEFSNETDEAGMPLFERVVDES